MIKIIKEIKVRIYVKEKGNKGETKSRKEGRRGGNERGR